jgi:hypothetical protein
LASRDTSKKTTTSAPATGGRKSGRKKATQSTPVASRKTTQSVPAPTGGTRVQHPARTGAIGTVANPSKQAVELKTAISKARKSIKWTFKDSVQPELLLQADGKTVCYLVQKDGASVITARTPSNQTLNVKDIGGSVSIAQAVKLILAHMDARAKQTGGRRSPAPAPAATDNLQKDLEETVKQTAKKAGNGDGKPAATSRRGRNSRSGVGSPRSAKRTRR